MAAAGFNEASQYIALMASASFLLLVQKLVGSALSSRCPLDTGKHKLRSLPNHRLRTSAFLWYFFQFIIDSTAAVCCF